jgi:putative oxidoreductase
MSFGILLLRVVLGLLLAAHGAQKLFGWFGGSGLSGTAAGFARLRFRAPLLMALAAALAEFAGGLLLAIGFATPLAALAFVVVMLNAIATAHWQNGLWNTKRGYEFNLVILTAAVAIAATGPGRFSLDSMFGWAASVSGPWWAIGALALGALLSAATLGPGRRSPDAMPAEEDAPNSRRPAAG